MKIETEAELKVIGTVEFTEFDEVDNEDNEFVLLRHFFKKVILVD